MRAKLLALPSLPMNMTQSTNGRMSSLMLRGAQLLMHLEYWYHRIC